MGVRDGVREEFEKWADSCGMPLERADRNMRTQDGLRLGCGAYLSMETRFAWSAWSTATPKAFGEGYLAGVDNGYRAGFRAASGEVEQ